MMCDAEYYENLLAKHKQLIDKFREKVSDVIKDEEDFYLLKWLKARNYDMKKSEKMLRESLVWREKFGADSIYENFVVPPIIKEFVPGGLCGFDKSGHPVYIESPGLSDIKGLMFSIKKSDFIKEKVVLCEKIQKLCKSQTAKLGRRINGVIVIYDLEHYGLKHMTKSVIETYTEVLHIFEANYPETLKRCYILNAPRFFPILYGLVKPFLSEDTRTKIQIPGRHWKQRLLEEIPAEELPVHWGGTRCEPDEFCSSMICMGGTVPKERYPANIDPPDLSQYDTLNIPRGSSQNLEFKVTERGMVLRWQFVTGKYDVGFGVFRKTNESSKKISKMEEIQAVTRVNSHMIPEDGSLMSDEGATYVLHFDNSYSWVHSKKVHHQVSLLPPDIEGLHMTPSVGAELSGMSQDTKETAELSGMSQDTKETAELSGMSQDTKETAELSGMSQDTKETAEHSGMSKDSKITGALNNNTENES